MRPVQFKLTTDDKKPWLTKAEIDGADRSQSIRAVTINATVGDIPTVTVDLFGGGVLFDGAADLRVSDEGRALLVGLGWTPPDGVPPRTVSASELEIIAQGQWAWHSRGKSWAGTWSECPDYERQAWRDKVKAGLRAAGFTVADGGAAA